MVRFAILILSFIGLFGCSQQAKRTPPIAIAYAGPATLKIRRDIPLESAVVAQAKHGERLEIVQHRRRFLRVRTSRGVEGWTDERLLLSQQEIETLRAFEKDVRTMPSQGIASTYDALNVHTEPDRQSPSFIQLKENEKFDVIAHRVAPRTSTPRKPLIPPPVKRTTARRKPRETGKFAPPPMPLPPPPPADWQRISVSPPEIQAAEAEARQPVPVPLEDWSLIRTARGESGWVLSSRLFLAIPDEVAQYAEGKRITAYFPLGEAIHDEDKVEHNWIWTTVSQSAQPYDFDSFRVFIWSLRRHRYETAYIERKVRGYFPVRLEQVQYGNPVKLRGGQVASNVYPGFSVCVEKEDGGRWRRSYAFLTNIIRFAGEKPCEVQPLENPKVPVDTVVASLEQPESAAGGSRSLLERFKGRLDGLRKRWFGR